MSADNASEKSELKQIPPLDPPMVPFVLTGMVFWLALALLSLVVSDDLEARGQGRWLSICVAGFIVAIPGLGLMIIHDRNRARRRRSV
jgi:Protein of unknown function (DUF2530)